MTNTVKEPTGVVVVMPGDECRGHFKGDINCVGHLAHPHVIVDGHDISRYVDLINVKDEGCTTKLTIRFPDVIIRDQD